MFPTVAGCINPGMGCTPAGQVSNCCAPNVCSTSFSTCDSPNSPATVNLRSAGKYVILSKAGISTVPPSAIKGNIGISPVTATAFTGFDPVTSHGTYATAGQVDGNMYAALMDSPTPSDLTVTIQDMMTAYTDAAGRSGPHEDILGTGDIGGRTLPAGLYRRANVLLITKDVTLAGGLNDVWIFQVGQGITVSANAKVILSGGAQAKNIFWQAAEAVTLNTNSVFHGILLAKTKVDMLGFATITGRILSQTAVTLIKNTVTEPT